MLSPRGTVCLPQVSCWFSYRNIAKIFGNRVPHMGYCSCCFFFVYLCLFLGCGLFPPLAPVCHAKHFNDDVFPQNEFNSRHMVAIPNQCILITVSSLQLKLNHFITSVHWSLTRIRDTVSLLCLEVWEMLHTLLRCLCVQRHTAAALWWRWYGRSNIDAVPAPPWLCADPPLPIPLR